MSARKRARTSGSPPTSLTSQPRPSQLTPSTLVWHAILPELLQRACSFLLCSSFGNHWLLGDIRLLFSLSSTCVAWCKLVYREDGVGWHVDVWSLMSTVTVVKCRNGRDVKLGDRKFSAALMPGILSSLRPAHALLLHFGKRRTLQGLVECFEPLQRYTQLTALHLDLSSAHGFKADRLTLRKAQDALDAALVAVACRNNNPLSSLTLRCSIASKKVVPSVDALRRVCSSVKQLYLSADELLLMAWGTDAQTADRVWTTHSVRSFVFPTDAQPRYFENEKAVVAFAASMPALTHLRIVQDQGAAKVKALLQQIGGRLQYLCCGNFSLHQLPSVASACTSLVSLSLHEEVVRNDRSNGAQELNIILACLPSLPAFKELTLYSNPEHSGAEVPMRLVPLPSLVYLHLYSWRAIDSFEQLSTLLTPNLTHLCLQLNRAQSLALLQSFDAQPLPQLAACHVGCAEGWGRAGGWREPLGRIRRQLGAAWCEKEDDVVHWRADRVRAREVGLPDLKPEYPHW